MHEDLRRVRHDLRGRLNTLTLAVAVLKMSDGNDALELLNQIERAADEAVELADHLDELTEAQQPN